VSIVLEAGAHKSFSGIRAFVVRKDDQNLNRVVSLKILFLRIFTKALHV
jgi:hypothetical protein